MTKEREWKGYKEMYKKILALAGALVLLSRCGGKKVDVPGTETQAEATVTSPSEETTAAVSETEETAAETTTSVLEEKKTKAETTVPEETGTYDLDGNEFVNFSMPEITVSMPHIDIPDVDVSAMIDQGMKDVLGETVSPSDENSADTTVSEAQAPETAAPENKAEAVETVISDSPNGFVYEGKVIEVGDERNGYIMVPDDFYVFKESDTKVMLQYSDSIGRNVITVNQIPEQNAYDATQLIMAALDEQGVLTGLTGAKVKMGDYDAYQVYGGYPDGVFFVCWVTEDKNDPGKCYYVSFEMDAEHQGIFALSSTYKMPKDHK